MSKEFIEKRLKEVEDALVQTLANHNALHGAKQELLHLLQNIAINVAEGVLTDALTKTDDVQTQEAPQV